jgi:signal transduction histidine kinase
MRFPDWMLKCISIPPSAKWDAGLLPALFLFNFFNFSTWFDLNRMTFNTGVIFPSLYGLAGLVLLAWRNRAPRAIFVTQWMLAVAAWPVMAEYVPVVGIPVALYAVSFHCGRRASLLALAASFILGELEAYAVSLKLSQPVWTTTLVPFVSNSLFFTFMVIGAWFLGRSVGASQRHRQRLEREQKIGQEIETLAVERRKIARELHDIVSHSVTVILVQANGAACIADTDFGHITETDFTRIKQSLAHITTTGTQTMAELGRLLDVLETGDATHDDVGISELKPQPGLADVATLLASLRGSGMPVDAHVEGLPRELDPSVDLTAYRIVQEGLTNILKHAGKDANPRLRLAWKPQSLLVQIDNDISSADAPCKSALSVGRGLVGLRERAHTVGGTLIAGPHHKGGYRLAATLPFSTSETSLIPDTLRPTS